MSDICRLDECCGLWEFVSQSINSQKKKKTDRTPWSGDTHTKCQYIEYVEDIQKDKVVYFGVWLYNPGYKNNLEKDSSLFLQV